MSLLQIAEDLGLSYKTLRQAYDEAEQDRLASFIGAVNRHCGSAVSEARCRRCGRTDCNHPDPHFAGIIPHVSSAQCSTGLPLASDRFVSASFHASTSISQVQQDHG